MNKSLIKSVMAKNDDTQEKLAEVLNLPVSGVCSRINGRIDFRASEISKIVKRYSLSPQETTDIFFEGSAS